MEITREIGKKGQVVIPKDIRDMLGVKEKQQIVFVVENNEVKIKPKQSPVDFINDFLNIPKIPGKSSVKSLKKEIMEQYDKKIY